MSVSGQRFPPEFEDWHSLPLSVRLSVALTVIWFRSPTYLLSRRGLSTVVAGLDLTLCLLFVPDHPMKLVASFGSACCAIVIAMALPDSSSGRLQRNPD